MEHVTYWNILKLSCFPCITEHQANTTTLATCNSSNGNDFITKKSSTCNQNTPKLKIIYFFIPIPIKSLNFPRRL